LLLEVFILCLETTYDVCSVAISKNGKSWICKELQGKNVHASSIHLLIQQAMDEAKSKVENFSFQNIKAIAISAGPGSYTGLRIGFSVAKSMAFALQIPLLSISTLEILYKNALLKNDCLENRNAIYSLLPARANEFYYSCFYLDKNAHKENDVITFEKMEDLAKVENALLVSVSAAKLPSENAIVLFDLSASLMAEIAYEYYISEKFSSVDYVEPNYIKQFKNNVI